MSDSKPEDNFALSRRSFLKTFGSSAAVAATAQVEAVAAELAKANAEKVQGPGTVPITLKVNGKSLKLDLEPRVTLLEALRNHSNLTGSKEVCDRGTCGACTVLFDAEPLYSFSNLAIKAKGHNITTTRGLVQAASLSSCSTPLIRQ